ncbi:MAG: glycosyltransferase family 4 protein [Bacteroidota bacterium]
MKKTVLFLHPSSDLYGADRSLLRTIKAITEMDIRVVVCLPYHGELEDHIRPLDCEVHVFGLGVMRRKYFSFPRIIGFGVGLIYAFIKVYLLARKEKAVAIHSNTTSLVVGPFVARAVGIPHIQHVREILVSPVFLRKFTAKLASRLSSRVIAVSQSVVQNLMIDEPQIEKKTIVINNGIDPNRYQVGNGQATRARWNIPNAATVVMMIARVHWWKGQDLFLKVAESLQVSDDQVYFMCVGSPFQGNEHLMDELFKSRNGLPDPNRFIIVPFQSRVSDYLDAADIFLLPSTLPDPFPTTVLEAMAMSKAIVVNGHGGACDMIIQGESGYIVRPPNDVEGFVHYVKKLLDDQSLRIQLGEHAQSRLNKHFTESMYCQKIQELFRDIAFQ